MTLAFGGMDFGNSNSTVAIMRDGRPELVPLEDGQVTLPSAIFFSFEDNRTLFGRKVDGLASEIPAGRPRLNTNRALAVGLYVMVYNIGGSMGAAVPGAIWKSYGWVGVVTLIVAVQILTMILAWNLWPARKPAAA